MQNLTCQKNDFRRSQDDEWTYLRRESGCRASKTFEIRKGEASCVKLAVPF